MKLVSLFSFCGVMLTAQTSTPFVSGLLNPSKLVITDSGSLLVTEAGSTPNSGRVSLIDKAGTRKTLVDGLPSGLAAPDLTPDGPDGLVLQDTTLYILNGEGDGFRAGTAPNTIVPNPSGPSSPLFSSILKVTFPVPIDSVVSPITLTAAQNATLADYGTVTMTDKTTVELLTDFRDGMADPVTAWRNSHPYGITALPNRPNRLYVVDAGMNQLYEVNLNSGRSQVIAHFAPFSNGGAVGVPPVSEAVPDSIRPFGTQLLVSFLRGFPFTPGGSQIASVDPDTGKVTPFIAGLSSPIDVLSIDGTGARPVFFTLEYSANQLAGAPGRVTRYDSPQGKVIADGLKGPTSLAYDSATGTLYVAVHDAGTIVKIAGQ